MFYACRRWLHLSEAIYAGQASTNGPTREVLTNSQRDGCRKDVSRNRRPNAPSLDHFRRAWHGHDTQYIVACESSAFLMLDKARYPITKR